MHPYTFVILAAAASFLLSGCAAPQQASRDDDAQQQQQQRAQRAAQLEQRLLEILETTETPALAVAVIEGDAITTRAVGTRIYRDPEPVSVDHHWHIGSCGKAMTASLIALLVERGKLRWDQTIAETFPKLVDTMQPAYRDVTLTQLLSHRGGLPGESWPGGTSRLMVDALPGEGRDQRYRYVELILQDAPAADPGTAFVYSNAGYTVAGAMAEAATGRDWEDLMTDLLFQPLEMSSAGFGAPGLDAPESHPWGHVARDEFLAPMPPGQFADNPVVLGPAGTMHFSIGDWARFVRWHLRAARGEWRRLAPESFEKLHSDPDEDGYALGWGVAEREWASGRTLSHAGSNTLWFASAWIAPRENFAFVIASNGGFDRGRKAVQAAEAVVIELFLTGSVADESR